MPTVTCLYVDDEPRLLEMSKEFLELSGSLRIITCDSSNSAKEMVLKGGIDVIISDYQMPGMDGIEFLRFVREEAESDIPFILFTGKGREEVAIMALNAGVDFYLNKGGDPRAQFAELENVVLQLVRRREAEGAVAYNIRRFRHIIENVLDIVLILNKKGQIKYASPSVLGMLGYAPREMIGMSEGSLMYPADDPSGLDVTTLMQMALGKPTEFRLRTKDGNYKWFEGVRNVFPPEFGKGDIIVSAWNIDARKKLEMALVKHERMLQAVFDNSNDYQLIIDIDGTIRAVNSKICERTGFTERELIGSQVMDLVPSAYQGIAIDHLQHKAKGENERTTYPLMFKDRVGNEYPIKLSSRLLMNYGGERLVIVTAADMAYIDEMYKDTIEANEYGRIAMDDADLIIAGWDRSGRINLFNKKAEKFTGVGAPFVLGKDITDVLKSADMLYDLGEDVRTFMNDGTITRPTYLMRFHKRDGRTCMVLWKIWAISKSGFSIGLVACGIEIADD